MNRYTRGSAERFSDHQDGILIKIISAVVTSGILQVLVAFYHCKDSNPPPPIKYKKKNKDMTEISSDFLFVINFKIIRRFKSFENDFIKQTIISYILLYVLVSVNYYNTNS